MFESTPTPWHALKPLAQESQDDHGMISMPVHFKMSNYSTKVGLSSFFYNVWLWKGDADCYAQLRIPDLPKRMLGDDGCRYTPYSSYLEDHIAWKRVLYPHESDEGLERSCLKDLGSVALGFPGVDDKAAVLCLAAQLLFTCDIDDIFETMDVATADYCVRSCVSILDGAAWKPHCKLHVRLPLSSQADFWDLAENPENPITKAQKYSAHYRKWLIELLRPSAATALIRDVQDMIQGQLPELKHNRNNTPLESLDHYLDLRFRPFGLYPLLTILEHHCLPEPPSERQQAELRSLKEQIIRIAIVQNDLGGVDKDWAEGNRSNVVFALAELDGEKIFTPEDLVRRPYIIDRAAEEHDRLIARAIQTWADIKRAEENGDARVAMAADMVMTVCVTHILWTLNTARYLAPKDRTSQELEARKY